MDGLPTGIRTPPRRLSPPPPPPPRRDIPSLDSAPPSGVPPPLRVDPLIEEAPKDDEQQNLLLQDSSPSYLPYHTFPLYQQEQTATKISSKGTTGGPPLLAYRQTSWPILVIATENANQIAWKNQLQLVDLFQGLAIKLDGATTTNSPVPPLRSMNQTLHLEWNQIQLQFIDSIPTSRHDAQPMLSQAAELHETDGDLQKELVFLQDSIVEELLSHQDLHENHLMDYSSARQRQLQERIQRASEITCNDAVPWMQRYRRALDHSTNGMEHNIRAPIVVLLVATTEEPVDDPVETLQTLQSPHYLPKEYSNGLFDPKLIEYKGLILHENYKESTVNLDDLNNRLGAAFGPGSAVVKINSMSPSVAEQLAAEESSDLWSGGGTKGCHLSVSDRVALRSFFALLVQRACIPAIERIVRTLNAIVSERKKGVRGVLKSLWRKDENTSIQKPGQQVMYPFDTVENQAQTLANTLFFIHDYEGAYSTYRLIKDDFKDKSQLHYGEVQEMLALSLYHLDPYNREKEIYSMIEGALLAYNRHGKPSLTGRPSVASPAARLATRLSLVLTSMPEISRDRFSEVADLLAATSSNEASLGAAVLLEQASRNYLSGGMHRKYAFHMLMSGHMFRGAEQQSHALRCFTAALHIYLDGQWVELQNHVWSALAAQLYGMGHMSTALQLYARLLGSVCIRVSPKSQEKFLSHLAEICRDFTKKAILGADRMAGSMKMNPSDRNRYCMDRFESIARICRSTKSASRFVEIPNLHLPLILEDSVRVVSENDISPEEETVPFSRGIGGDPEEWKDLELTMKSEIRASETDSDSSAQNANKFLAQIDDHWVQQVIAEIDKENATELMLERSRRATSHRMTPASRAVCEPITVEFTMENRLSVAIVATDIQLVARMSRQTENQCSTNEYPIKITPLESYDVQDTWTFQGSSTKFFVPEFSVTGSNDASSKEKWKTAQESGPYFVGTRTSIRLEPGSKVDIRLSICPLLEGDIEILGARWKIAESFWIFHPFHMKGHLLQNTRRNRAHRVRGERVELKARIRHKMPCLSISMSPIGKEERVFLQGQVSGWRLQVRNIGTAPAGRLYLKTSAPWVVLENNRNACVGASGTLLRIPLHGSKSDDRLDPNEELEVNMRIRTSGKGREMFYMLFRYERFNIGSEETVEYRWLRKCYDVNVYPSLTFAASAMPSWSTETYNLSFELTNYRSDTPDNLELNLEKFCLLSTHYCLKERRHELMSNRPSGLVGWQERMSYHLQLLEQSGLQRGLLFSECDLDSMSINEHPIENNELLSFICMERAHNSFQSELDKYKKNVKSAAASHADEENHPRSVAQIRRANTSAIERDDKEDDDKKDHPIAVSRLFDDREDKIHLFCTWKERSGMRGGHHFIRDLVIKPISSAACPISVSAVYPSIAENRDGTISPRVKILVVLRNKLPSGNVSFDFAVEESDAFDWVGRSSFSSVLEATAAQTIELAAHFNRKGVHNLQKVRLTVKRKNQVKTFAFPQQWLVQSG